MQVSVEKVSNIERKLSIKVPAEQVESAYTKKINDFVRKSNIKGFRPGKAPISYIQQRFGDQARQEALGEIIQSATYEALKDHQLQPISTPRINPKMMQPGQPLEFEVMIEILPEIDQIKFSLGQFEKMIVDITDDDINYVIKQISKQYTKWLAVEREAKQNDRVIIDYESKIDKANESKKNTDFPVEIGSKSMIVGFEDALIGMKVGDEKTFKLNFPEDYGNKEIAGKPVEFTVTIRQVLEPENVEVNESFVKQFGIASGKTEDLKKQIRLSLEQERDRLLKDKIKEQVFNQLLNDNPIEVPQSLIEREAKRIHDELYPSHKNQKDHQHSSEEVSKFNDTAKKRVAVGILIGEYAKQNKMKADKDSVQKRIEEIASVYEQPKEVIAWLSSGDRLSNIESQVLEDQILDKLISGIQSIDKRITYAELKGFVYNI